jgi:hypothetical protein
MFNHEGHENHEENKNFMSFMPFMVNFSLVLACPIMG